MDERVQRFLDTAIEREWVTREQVDECLKIRETVKEVGIDQKVEEILVKKGYLTPDQARTLSRELSKLKVGKYQILEKLGEGGAGIVYKANQEPLERVVAIKVLSKRRTTSDQYLERFLREARIAVTLNHQNIVKGLDYGEADGYHYFVMEYVEGESLYDVLQKEGTLDEKRALEIALQAVNALQHAAKYDLVHRDIKPENLMITREKVVKLCDLGLAKPSLVETAKASRDGTTIGTPTYMSPEQIRGRDETDFRSDVYSLGATLYHMVTGQPPFTGASADVVVRKHLQEDVTDPRELSLNLSSSTAAVILKMLAKRAADRYGSLDSLAEDLQAVVAGRPPRHTIQVGRQTAAKAPVDLEELSSRRERQDREKKRKLLMSLALTVCVVVVAAAGVIVLNPFGKGSGEEVRPKAEEPSEVKPVEPSGPSQDELAEEYYKEVLEFARAHPEASPDSMIDRLNLVVERYPGTRWELMARDRIRDLEQVKVDAARRHLAEAKKAHDELSGEVDRLVGERRYGEALKKLAEYPEEYADTDYPGRLERRGERVRQEAEEKAEELLSAADSQMRGGRFAEAVETLESLIGFGLPEIEGRAREKLEEVRVAEGVERKARARGKVSFRNVVGTAYGYAAEGRFRDAEEFLVRAEEREELTYYRQDLTKAWQDLREARRFAKALPKGAATLTGQNERLNLVSGARKLGKVLGADEKSIRLARGPGEEPIRYAALSPADRIRIAFLALDEEKPEDHRAAALYLIVCGFLEDANSEIDAAKILGADPAPLLARRDLQAEYLRDRVDSEIRKADVKIAQKRLDEARKILEAAVDRAPWYDLPRIHLGRALLAAGKSAEALKQLLRAREIGSKEPQLDYWLGEALLAEERSEEALEAFKRFAAAADPEDPHLVKARGRLRELKTRVFEEKIRELEGQAKLAFRGRAWDQAIDL
ncbi:MAG: serine/threonine-protein kinase, partial [Planctomycetota bacterium]